MIVFGGTGKYHWNSLKNEQISWLHDNAIIFMTVSANTTSQEISLTLKGKVGLMVYLSSIFVALLHFISMAVILLRFIFLSKYFLYWYQKLVFWFFQNTPFNLILFQLFVISSNVPVFEILKPKYQILASSYIYRFSFHRFLVPLSFLTMLLGTLFYWSWLLVEVLSLLRWVSGLCNWDLLHPGLLPAKVLVHNCSFFPHLIFFHHGFGVFPRVF